MAQLVQSPLERYESEQAAGSLPWRLFSISLVILFLVLLTYFGLAFGYTKVLQDRLESQNRELDLLAKRMAQSQSDQNSFTLFYSQLVNLKTIFSNHIVSSGVWSLLGSLTHPKVYFSGAALKIGERQLDLDGVSESFAVLSEQMESWNRNPSVEQVLVPQAQRGEEGIRFKATLIFKKNIFSQ